MRKKSVGRPREVKMSQEEMKSLLGVARATFSDWKKRDNPKHNLYLFLRAFEYDEVKSVVEAEAAKERFGV